MPLKLADSLKSYTYDQDKALTPQETVRRFKERLAAVDLDILHEVRRIDRGRLGIPVYFSVCGKDAHRVIGTKKQMGKGGTPEQAEASAVMELAERFSFFSFVKERPFPVATWAELAQKTGAELLPYEAIGRSVHDDNAEAVRGLFEQVPMRWVEGVSLASGKSVMLPLDWFYAINEFNGPSAGNSLEEAISQGLCEVVERHVSALVAHGRLRTPAIDPATARSEAARHLLAKFAACGVVLHLRDFSLDTGIPTVGAIAWDPATYPKHSEIVFTAGTTPGPEKALIRALTEVAQLAGDFNTPTRYVASGLPKFDSLEEAAWVTEPPGPAVALDTLPDLSDANIRVEVERCAAALSERGLETFIVDITHPKLGIPAIYTIVPGAHFRERAMGSVGLFAAKLISQSAEPERALELLGTLDGAHPGLYYLAFYRGQALLALERPALALEEFRRALASRPKDEDRESVLTYAALCHRDLGQYAEAVALLKEALELGESAEVHNQIGFCHFKLRRHEESIAHFRRAIDLDPAQAINHANIGSNLREMGRLDEAIAHYELALAIDPTLDFARECLARLKGPQGA
jgi:ribosomal protein S12 methylthiotransferase accessory factor